MSLIVIILQTLSSGLLLKIIESTTFSQVYCMHGLLAVIFDLAVWRIL